MPRRRSPSRSRSTGRTTGTSAAGTAPADERLWDELSLPTWRDAVTVAG